MELVKKRMITLDEYHKMAEVGILSEKDHVELINGEIIKMSPIGSKHAKYVNKLNLILTRALGDDYIISVQNPIVLSDDLELQPDFIVLKKESSFYETSLPTSKDALLIIEVSDSSLAFDKTEKTALYSQSGISEYWVLDINKNEIIQFTKPSEDNYRVIKIFKEIDDMRAEIVEFNISGKEIFG